MGLWSWLAGPRPDEAAVRSEIGRLGSRYRGKSLEGARDELRAPGLGRGRAQLLRACVKRLRTL